MNVSMVAGQHAARWRRRGGDGVCLVCRLGMGMNMRWRGGSSSSRKRKRYDRSVGISIPTFSVRDSYGYGYGYNRKYHTGSHNVGKQVGCRNTVMDGKENGIDRFRAGGYNGVRWLGDSYNFNLDKKRIAGLWMMQRQLYSTRAEGSSLEDEGHTGEELVQRLGQQMDGMEGEGERERYTFKEGSAEQEDLLEQGHTEENVSEADLDKGQGPQTLEGSVRAIRQAFGEELPDGVLTDEAYALYIRLYGSPLCRSEANSEEDNDGIIEEAEVGEDEVEENALYKTGKDGEMEEVEFEEEGEEAEDTTDLRDTRPMKAEETIGAKHEDSSIDLEEESRAATDETEEEVAPYDEPEDHTLRAHPLTDAGRFQTQPATVQLSRSTFIKPVSDMLADISNKHLKETAHESFGGVGLPLSTATPKGTGKHIKQRPITLQAGQRHMSEREGDVFMAALMPGMYTSVVSALAEVRRRLGSSWLEGLLLKDNNSHLENDQNTTKDQERDEDDNTARGPLILDAGSGGAAVFAFRDMLRAEWERMHDAPGLADNEKQTAGPPPPSPAALSSSSSTSSYTRKQSPAPTGKATVLTGSAALRQRASRLLSDTTFLPRLPDTVPDATEPDPNIAQPRKRYDVIVASHTLWPLDEPYLRKQHVEKLWSLLNPDGGVLLLLEKGLPKGFEAVAGARALLLDRFIASPGSTEYERIMPSAKKSSKDTKSSSSSSPSAPDARTHPLSESSPTSQFIEKETGMIIAPCTNHSTCPMYTRPDITTGRKDLCHFSQRFFRPQYLQNILGARDKNFDDVLFSYVAVQRGRDGRRRMEKKVESGVDGVAVVTEHDARPFIAQGELATAAAFGGYEDEFMPSMSDRVTSESTSISNADNTDVDGIPIDPTGAFKSDTKIPIEAYIPPDTTLNQTLLSLPRTILPPLKRRGHVILDLCTPAGRLERWTVPRSFSKQAYRDARKCKWGDLWALGAKTRVSREPRVGKYGRRSKDVSKMKKEDKNEKRDKEMDLGEEIFSGLGVDANGGIDDGIDENIEAELMKDLERSRRGLGGAGGGFDENVDKVADFSKPTRRDENSSAKRKRGNDRANRGRPGRTGRKENDDYDGGILSSSESVSPLGDSSLLDAISFEEEEERGGKNRRRSRGQTGVERRERQTVMDDQEVERKREKKIKKEMAASKRVKGAATAKKDGKEDRKRRRR